MRDGGKPKHGWFIQALMHFLYLFGEMRDEGKGGEVF
jgi:hypothetical protein